MKQGFTLAELLITLAMIGVLAAITVPTLAKLKPDETKAKYLKAYNVLVTNTDEILSDTSLYWTTYDNSGKSDCIGLGCWDINNEEDGGFIDTPGFPSEREANVDKYPRLLVNRFNLSEKPDEASVDPISFTTVDGVYWLFEDTKNETIDGKRALTYNLTIDIDGPDKGNNSDYSSNSKPDQFKFKIDTYGKVLPDDPLGKAFLKNPTEMKMSDKDRKLADSYKSSK